MRYLQTKVGHLQTILGNEGGWCYLWSIDVGRADPEKPNGKESKGRKGLRFYE